MKAMNFTLLVGLCIAFMGSQPLQAVIDPNGMQSLNVAIVDTTTVIHGGYFPTSGGEFDQFNFTNLPIPDVDPAHLAAFDTVLLNMSSPGTLCNAANLSASQKADLVDFVYNGGKLIIYDSECTENGYVDYSWLPYPFTTNNPGAMGAHGTLNIVEENVLSSNDPSSVYYINATALGFQTDAVGDMNVMVSYDPAWFIDMYGINYNTAEGPVHTYARFGMGLMIYNGLDVDYMPSDPANTLSETWLQELLCHFNPTPEDDLPGLVSIGRIALNPTSAVNEVGSEHTVTATVTDIGTGVAVPIEGVQVTFVVISGPNAGTSGTCSADASCLTDANGQVSFTYTGTGGLGIDEIQAYFTDENGNVKESQIVDKEWIAPPVLPIYIDIKPGSCPNPLRVRSQGVLPVAILGTEDFDVATIDVATITLAGVSPIRSSFEDVGTPLDPEYDCECHSAGADGYIDLTLKFDRQQIIATLGDLSLLPRRSVIPLTLSCMAMDNDEVTLEGTDCIVLLNYRKR